jgi:small-conductance mechanosensitive channel
MEENKKEEIKQEETQVEDTQTKALLEPSPYKRKATDDTATVSEDTSSEEEATPDEERPVNAEEKVFKKRYDDLKRHYDSTVNKHKDDVSKLKRQLEESAEQVLPKTKEEIEAWRTKYPDVYDVIETIAHTKADEKAKKIQTELKELESQQAVVQRDKAEVELAKIHPYYHDIRGY